MDDGESGVRSARVAAAAASEPLRPELADVGRLGRRLVRLVVAAARAEDHPLQRWPSGHLGLGGPAYRW